MAQIQFLPTCSECGSVLWGRHINLVKMLASVDIEKGECEFKYVADYAVCPKFCPVCGNELESITMPTKLPFDCSSKPEYQH